VTVVTGLYYVMQWGENAHLATKNKIWPEIVENL